MVQSFSKAIEDTHTQDSKTEDKFTPTFQHDSKRNEHKQEKNILIAFVCLNFIMMSVITILVVTIWKEKSSPIPVTKFCLSRTLIEGHPYDREDLRFCNTTHCCFQNVNSTGKIISNMTSRWLKEKIMKDTERRYPRYECDNGKSQTKAIKANTIKLSAPLLQTQRSTECPTCILWNTTSDNAILPRDTSYFSLHEENGFIEIKRSGMYHVYSQVNINYGENVLQNFYHHVIVRKNIDDVRTEKVLMRDFNSQCACKYNTQLFSSYLGSDFYLNIYDKLAVEVYSESILAMPPDSNFYGIHKW